MEEQLNDCIYSWISAAAFFITYENVKSVLHQGSASYLTPAKHMVAASLGEVVRKKFIHCVPGGGEGTVQLWKLSMDFAETNSVCDWLVGCSIL